MDLRGCALAVALLVACLCASLTSAAPADTGLEQMSPGMKLSYLEKMFRENVDRDLVDISDMHDALRRHMNSLEAKKRQLEIKKRQPVQCFLNIVSCWKK